MPSDRLDLIWTSAEEQSTEHFALRSSDEITTLRGNVVLRSERSGTSSFTLGTSPEGVVTRCGDGLWLATSLVRS